MDTLRIAAGRKRRSSRRGWLGRARLAAERLEDRCLLSAVIGNNIAVGDALRNYRLAIAATAEYTAYHGGAAAALSAIQATVAALNGLYERELAIHFDLVSGSDSVFTDSATDGYTNGDTLAMLDENQAILDALVGSGNYDLGHVFGTGGGGQATLGAVGLDGSKARGATTSFAPSGPLFLNTVAHEIGHQFGADHTFNSVLVGSSCQFQREGSNAYEPGSGSTLMSYAGICPFGAGPPNDNLQADPDQVFHSASFEQIQEQTDPTNNPHAAPHSTTPLGNHIPAVDGGPDFVIPARTPFQLTATVADADAGDRLKYSWEQLDVGPPQGLPVSDNGSGPLFRAWKPAEDPNRFFPRLSDLAAGVDTAALGEVLPSTSRILNFRVTVRDGIGGVDSDDVRVDVRDTGAPFAVTFPNTAATWIGGSQRTVTWNVAGTDANGIHTATVEILLSTDGGATFPYSLGTTPNDGSHTITVPNLDAAGTGRIMIRSSGNVFFDISDANFTLQSNASAAGISVVESGGLTRVFEGYTVDTYSVALNTVPTNGPVTLAVSAGDQLEISLDGVVFASSLSLTLVNTSPRTVLVRAVDDTVGEGLHGDWIAHTVSAGASAEYPVGAPLPGVSAGISDDELPPLVGVDFQPPQFPTPRNWTGIETFSNTTLQNLIREDGAGTAFDLEISQPSGSIVYNGDSPPVGYTVPEHRPALDAIGGLLTNYNQTSPQIGFTWQDLTPGARYGVYVFVVEYFGDVFDANQTVTITGSGADDPAPFEQTTRLREGLLLVNGELGDDDAAVQSYAQLVTADANGEIEIEILANVAAGADPEVYVAGLAIHEVPPDKPVPRPLFVTAATAEPSGAAVSFSQPIDPSWLNLFDASGAWGPADVSLVGAATGQVQGTLTLSDGDRRLTFVRSGGPLAADTYTLTLRSAADGVRDQSGVILDGNLDGMPGGDYVFAFTVSGPPRPVVRLPDFSRGPGQGVRVPDTGAGLPLSISDAAGVSTVEVTIRFDPALLSISAASLGAGAPAGSGLNFQPAGPGEVRVVFTSPTPLPAGSAELVTLEATVPAEATPGAAHVLDLLGLRVNGGLLPAVEDDAVHAVAHLGDATGNGDYSGLDAQRIARVVVGLDSGFAAFPRIDPTVIADVTGNGGLSSFDAVIVAQEVVQLDPPEIPPLPAPPGSPRPAEPHPLATFAPAAIPFELGGEFALVGYSPSADAPLTVAARPSYVPVMQRLLPAVSLLPAASQRELLAAARVDNVFRALGRDDPGEEPQESLEQAFAEFLGQMP